MKVAKFFAVLLISMSVLSSMFMTTFAQSNVLCDSCGMTVDATGQARFNIVDADGGRHYACCPICALKMIKTFGQLNITSFCDWNGPSYPITIVAKQNGSVLTVNPQTAIVILGGGCTKNRLVYNAAAADALLAPSNNGSSQWLSPLTNATVAANATRMGIAQAVLQYGGGVTSDCEQCGMDVDVTGQARFKIFDASGTLHIACCPACALKMLKTYGALNYTSFCDYYGPNYPITIVAKANGSDVTVTPSSALVVIGGSCTKNRLVYNATAADALLAPPNNGTSKWLSPLTNATVAANATRLGVVQAALQFGGGLSPTPTPAPTPIPTPEPTYSPSSTQAPTPTPSSMPTVTPMPSDSVTDSPTSSPIPTPSPSPTPSAVPTISPEPTAPLGQDTVSDQVCEACDMAVTADDRYHFKVTDGNGQVHYVECFMCALNLVKRYDTLSIQTFCDWYGPDHPITIESTGFGAQVTVTPSTALYLYTGSCENNRVAYDETAANYLTTSYSMYTSAFQQHEWQFTPTVTTVKEGVNMYNEMSPQEGAASIMVPVLIAVICIIAVAIVIVAYKKLKRK